MMRPIGNHVQAAILRAVLAEAGLDGIDRKKPIMTIESIRSDEWASATFVGARHEIAIRIGGDDASVDTAVDRLVSGLAERDIPIAGQIVAEIGVTPGNKNKRNVNMVEVTLMVNVLTIID